MATSGPDDAAEVFSDPLNSSRSDFSYSVHIMSLLALISSALASIFIYGKLRRNFSVSVNCWFCCGNTRIPHAQLNNWICPTCEQYNGFNQDGDYNRIIKEQYDEKLNVPVFDKLRSSRVVNGKSCTPESRAEGKQFCKLCNINQKLKIQQLALFVPMNESNYDNEVEEYRQKLEKAYKLCSSCDNIVKETLERQESGFLSEQIKLVDQMTSASNECGNESEPFFGIMKFIIYHWNRVVKAVEAMLILSSSILLTALVSQWERENSHIITAKCPCWKFLMPYYEPVSEAISTYSTQVYTFRWGISFVAFLLSLLLLANDRRTKGKLKAFIWGSLHAALWFPCLGFQVLVSGVCFMSNFPRIKETGKFILTKKPRKLSLRTAKSSLEKCANGFQSACDVVGTFARSSLDGSLSEEEGDIRRYRLVGGNERGEHRERTTGNEVESPASEESGVQRVQRELTHDASPSKTSFPDLGSERRERELSPGLSQVSTDLSGLSLGQKLPGKFKKKPSNFLFENHEFFKKCPPSSSPIIKPAKLARHVSSSTPWMGQESGDSFSRSSTPSSGYSSQKLDHHFDLGKCMGSSPARTPSTPCGPRHHFGCCDSETSRIYNFNWCPFEFVPFNHYPNPVGHAALYSYARPMTPLFSAARSPPWRLPPSNLSEANVFENASKILADEKKWFKIKTVSYYFSISLNFVTLVVLVYLLSSGLVSIDWNLPRINMFA